MIKQLIAPKDAKAILTVQIPAYEVEAMFIQSRSIPPLHDTVESIQLCDETFYGYYSEGRLTGFISYQCEDNVLDIHRLVVHPTFFRQGIASKLLQFIEQLEPTVKKIIVSTGSANKPALQFYLKHGFVAIDQMQVGEYLWITKLEKQITTKTT